MANVVGEKIRERTVKYVAQIQTSDLVVNPTALKSQSEKKCIRAACSL